MLLRLQALGFKALFINDTLNYVPWPSLLLLTLLYKFVGTLQKIGSR